MCLIKMYFVIDGKYKSQDKNQLALSPYSTLHCVTGFLLMLQA